MLETRGIIGNRGGMKLKVNEWYECLQIGEIGEKFTTKHQRKIILPIIDQFLYANRFEYNLNKIGKDKQRQGINGEINLNFSYEVKTRTKNWGDILLETISVIEKIVPGWFFTSKANAIVYYFLNRQREIDEGYIILLNQTRKYFTEAVLERYPKKIAKTERNNYCYHTENRAIPFDAFPKKSLIHIQFGKKQITLSEYIRKNKEV